MVHNAGPVWFVYIVRCSDNSLYTGISTDPPCRVAMHNAGKGAKYTRSRRPVQLEVMFGGFTRSEALSAEYKIKQLSRRKKNQVLLMHQTEQLLQFLARIFPK